MRYLIFNVTVLAALGYLFMASPDQSPKLDRQSAADVRRGAMAGREPVADGNPEATAGSALLEAVEPAVDQVLSTSDGMYSEPAPTDGPSEATPPSDIHAIARKRHRRGRQRPAGHNAGYREHHRSLLDAKAAETGDVAAGGEPASGGEEVELVEPGPGHRPSGGSPSHAASAEAVPDQTLQALSGARADDAAQSQAALQDMNDEEIAAAFEPFRQSASSEPVTPQPGQGAEMADRAAGVPGAGPGVGRQRPGPVHLGCGHSGRHDPRPEGERPCPGGRGAAAHVWNAQWVIVKI